jgi:hypothetical protein
LDVKKTIADDKLTFEHAVVVAGPSDEDNQEKKPHKQVLKDKADLIEKQRMEKEIRDATQRNLNAELKVLWNRKVGSFLERRANLESWAQDFCSVSSDADVEEFVPNSRCVLVKRRRPATGRASKRRVSS